MTEGVIIEKTEGVLRLVMNRPQKKNALTGVMYQAMTAALKEADSSDEIRAIVLEGAGDNFSAGNDLADFLATATRGEANHAFPFISQVALSQTPIVAAVKGDAVGVGTTILFHCDLVYATKDARLRMPFVDLGLSPEAASSLLAPARFGMARASEYILLGEAFNGEKAVELGLANAVVAAEQLSTTAMDAARKLASKPVQALKASRALLRGDPSQIKEVLDAEMKVFTQCLMSPEARSAFEAFLKRSTTRAQAG